MSAIDTANLEDEGFSRMITATEGQIQITENVILEQPEDTFELSKKVNKRNLIDQKAQQELDAAILGPTEAPETQRPQANKAIYSDYINSSFIF